MFWNDTRPKFCFPPTIPINTYNYSTKQRVYIISDIPIIVFKQSLKIHQTCDSYSESVEDSINSKRLELILCYNIRF